MNVPSPSYVLTRLDVYNWGAFGGRHSAAIDLAGTAIIGPTGSGKTTLVDALMTLLVAIPRYNLASTGGHDSDRDLVSYVRGVAGAGNADAGNAHIARPGPVVSGVAARFDSGDAVLRVGGVFWFDGTSSAVDDLKRRWLFCTAEQPDLDTWLERHHDGGAAALTELERTQAGCKVYKTKQAFLARLRGHFEVGENAFALLNRASGLKQLDSIDKVFRELVLDDHSAFAQAAEVASQFDTLAGIRAELETARRQRASLVPIAAGAATLDEAQAKQAQLTQLKRTLPVWFAEQARGRWQAEQAALAAKRTQLADAIDGVQRRIAVAEDAEQTAHTAYLRAGGADIERLRAQIRTQAELVTARTHAAHAYQQRARALELDPTLTAAAVAASIEAARAARPRRVQESQHLQQAAWDAGVARTDVEKRATALTRELEAVRERPGSNIPSNQHRFRHALAQALGLDDDDVPFIAELVEVKPGEQRWRGAIERALGGERLRLLVDPAHADAALAWINQRDQHLRVRLHEADPTAATAAAFADGFVAKLNVKAHPLERALRRVLASMDRHCVADTATLRRTPHAMTAEGLLSGRRHFFDKDDRAPLASGWMTGFDNRDRIAELQAGIAETAQQLAGARQQESATRAHAESARNGLRLLDELAQTVFETIDQPGAEAALASLRQQLATLEAPESDAALAEQRWTDAKAAVATLRSELITLQADDTDTERRHAAASKQIERLARRIGDGLAEADRAWAAERFAVPEDAPLDALDEHEREAAATLQAELDTATSRVNLTTQRLLKDMKDAQRVDTGALAEAGCEVVDLPVYLARLQTLEHEALPEKLQRFRTYLNQSSDQGVTQLLSEVDNAVSMIEERIAELNATLERVDFQPGQYLRLEPQRVQHESLHTLRQARAELRSAELKDDAGESHYAALARMVALLRDAVERRKTQGALALLDPRYRLQFAVLVIERAGGRIIEKRTSSQGGSGGEKEIIASYVLTASLSYALCPRGGVQPLFATIVLDEAFSKSSQAVAGRIIRALAEFGLHPLFVTPNKELRLLREHTRAAVVVHRRGSQATLTSLSWEALEARAREHAAARAREHTLEVP